MSDDAAVSPARRALGALALAVTLSMLWAAPAAADPAEPGEYRSEVTSVEPVNGAVTVEVVGGDGFLQVRAAEGHEVVVEGYLGEPYLRFSADGTVARNLRSEATYINEDRFGAVEVPDGLSPDDEPEWEVVDDDGEYAWHDHRIHWMSPEPPPGVSPGEVIYDDWTVPLQVDGQPVVVHGRLTWERGVSPLPWIGVAVVVAAGLFAAARGRSIPVVAAALLVAGTAATFVGAMERASIPEGAGGSPLAVIVPALATVAALAALVRFRTTVGPIAALASVALLAGWALLRLAVLLEPVLPTTLPAGVDRAGTAVAIGAALAAAVVVVRSGALHLPELTDDDEGDAGK